MGCTTLRFPLWRGTPSPSVMRDIANAAHVYPGCFASENASGYLVNGADTASTRLAGIAVGGGTGTKDADFQVEVIPGGIIKMKNSGTNALTQAHVGKHCYIEDNETVASTSVNKIRAGIVEEVESDGVWVNVRSEAYREAVDLEDGGDDELVMTGILPGLHASTHEAAGADPVSSLPTADQKAALAGTDGAPAVGNKYVTNSDARNTNARTPVAHKASHEPGGGDAMGNCGFTAAGGVGTVWDAAAPSTTTSALDRIAAELARMPGAPIRSASSHAALYLDGGAGGDDAHTGLSWAEAKKTLAGVLPLVPPFGWCTIYAKGYGADSLTPAGGCIPYVGYRGHLRIVGCDAFEVHDTGLGTYVSAGGAHGRDLVTPTWSAHVVAATDDSWWYEITDDAGAIHIRKIETVNVGGGTYDVEHDTALTVTGGKAIRLVRPVTHFDFSAAAWTNTYPGEGDVMFIGCEVDASGANSLYGFSFACCTLDLSAHDQAMYLGPNSVLGGVLKALGLGIADLTVCPVSLLAGSFLETRMSAAAMLPANNIIGKTTASIIQTLVQGAIGAHRVINDVLNLVSLYVAHKGVELTTTGCAAHEETSGIEVTDGADVWLGACNLGRCPGSDDGTFRFTADCTLAQIDCSYNGHAKADGSTLRTITIARAAAHDSICVDQGRLSDFALLKFVGGYALATPATPQPAFRHCGDVDSCEIDLAAGIDRGAGPLVLASHGRQYWGAKFEGDNSNAAGWGLSAHDGVEMDIPNAGLTGNAGGTTNWVIGHLGAHAVPGAGTRLNDLAADPAGDEELVQIFQRA